MIRWLRVLIGVYACVATMAVGAEAARVELQGKWFVVDGEPFLVKGVGYSPYRPGQSPWKDHVGLDVMKEDFVKIHEAGFNTIRTWAPLTPEQLALARQHGLMVLQGIWVDPKGNFTSEAFRAMTTQIVTQEVERAKQSDAVLAVLVGNELSPDQVYQTGVTETEALLRAATSAAKEADPSRLVSHANWPQLSMLDASIWDFIGFNVYPYEPVSVAQSFGFASYIRHLKRTVARDKPLIITEVGLSVSPTAGSRPGYGGLSLDAQAWELVKLWDTAYQAGAQGACVFEWNDEWWKQGTYQGDERVHDADDPEEWFGITEFPTTPPAEHAPSEAEPRQTVEPRPAYFAFKAYNQAVFVEPVSDEAYQEGVPVSVYTTEAVASVRVRVGRGKWSAIAHTSPHWWRAVVPLTRMRKPKRVNVVLEARDRAGKLIIGHERSIVIGAQPPPSMTLTIETDRDRYEVTQALQPIQFVIRVADGQGHPVANQPVAWSIAEPQSKTELSQTKTTNQDGKIEGTYLIREPGLVTVAAATAPDRKRSDRRIGAERTIVVAKPPAPPPEPPLAHYPSPWERRLSPDIQEALRHHEPAFRLAEPGTEAVVDYARYGKFHGVGTAQYQYELLDREGLAKAVGEGIYPNDAGLLHDPAYRKALENNRLDGNIWDFVYHDDPQLAFFKWAGSMEESEGVKQFFTAMILERAGLLRAAVKAYYAILVHFPGAVGWTEFKTPWYVGKTARDKLEALLRLHPELGLRLEDARIVVEHGFDNDVDNDVVIPYPGHLVRVPPEAVNPPSEDLSRVPITRGLGKGRVTLRQYANRHWQLLVDGKPWVIRGLSYQPSAVGESPDEGTLQDWMVADRNKNGKPDGPFDTFVDANRNNRQDPDEPTIGDFQLLKDLGVNTIRLYHHASNKALLRQLYEQDGIMVLMGDLVGMYTVGSGAKWEEGTNYLDQRQRKRMRESVRQMVREFKDEPYLLMWVLGNENNYGGVHGIIGGRGNAAQYPKEFYEFLNELATWIHREDPNHPVAIANGEWLFLDLVAKSAPAIDVFGANIYRGSHGFGRSFFEAVQEQLDKPVLISEFGCPAYRVDQSLEIGELGQALYHVGGWVDLEDNMAGRGVGNAIGGVVFEWVDEWWKAGQPPRFSPRVHETTSNFHGPFPGGQMFEEWLGITSQGDGSLSPYLRQLRKTYWLYQALWKQ